MKCSSFLLKMNLFLPVSLVLNLGDSCINQLLSITHEIYSSFDEGLEVRSIFLDIAKAFSTWKNVSAGVPQSSMLGPLLFLIYINDLTEGLSTNAKLFADDYSLFSVIHNIQTSANNLNKDLERISNWATQ